MAQELELKECLCHIGVVHGSKAPTAQWTCENLANYCWGDLPSQTFLIAGCCPNNDCGKAEVGSGPQRTPEENLVSWVLFSGKTSG